MRRRRRNTGMKKNRDPRLTKIYILYQRIIAVMLIINLKYEYVRNINMEKIYLTKITPGTGVMGDYTPLNNHHNDFSKFVSKVTLANSVVRDIEKGMMKYLQEGHNKRMKTKKGRKKRKEISSLLSRLKIKI